MEHPETGEEGIFNLDGLKATVYEGCMPQKKATRTGLRIQLQGLRTIQELRAMVHEAFDNLEALGITHGRGVNLYLTPCDAEGLMVTPLGSGRTKINQITIEGPYPSAADEHGA